MGATDYLDSCAHELEQFAIDRPEFRSIVGIVDGVTLGLMDLANPSFTGPANLVRWATYGAIGPMGADTGVNYK